jgi:WD40 repeat protein
MGQTFIRKPFCSIMCIAFLPDGKNIIAGTLDHKILIYNIEDGSELLIGSHKGAVLSIAVSADGKVAASGSTDYTVRLWDLGNREELACFHGHSDIINAVSFSPDGLQIASGSADCTVRIWKIQKYKELQQELIEHKKDIMDIRFSDTGKYLISGSGDGKIHLHNESGVYMKSFQDSGNIFKIGFTHAENKILSTDNLSIRIHELNGKTH